MPVKALKKVHLSTSVDDGELGPWVLSKATGYREAEEREGMCVSICTAIGSTISTVVLVN